MMSHAKHYLDEYRWAVYPCRSKAPMIAWKIYQTRLPTHEEIYTWWSHYPDAQIGMSPRDIFVIDLDVGYNPDDVKRLGIPPTAVAKTPSGGRHIYLRNPDPGVTIKNRANVYPKIDVRAQGGNVILPPSAAPSGKRYEWIMSPEDVDIATAPLDLLMKFGEKTERVDYKKIDKGVSQGGRNDSAASLIGHLLRYLPPESWNHPVWPLILAWNDNNKPPLPYGELEKTFDSIAAAEMKRRGISEQ